MNKKLTDILSIIVGIMSILVIIYRIIFLMIPEIIKGFETFHIPRIFGALSLLV